MASAPDDNLHNPLDTLVQRTAQAGLVQPLRLALDILRPLDVICSQCALFAQPFVRGTAWEQPVALLGEADAWQHLRTRLAAIAPAADEPPQKP